MKWTIGTKIGGGFALALVALLVIGIVSYRSISGLIETAGQVTHTHLVIENLEQLIARRAPISISMKLVYAAQACRALDYAHKRGIVHR